MRYRGVRPNLVFKVNGGPEPDIAPSQHLHVMRRLNGSAANPGISSKEVGRNILV